jgi:hypothetical protein
MIGVLERGLTFASGKPQAYTSGGSHQGLTASAIGHQHHYIQGKGDDRQI